MDVQETSSCKRSTCTLYAGKNVHTSILYKKPLSGRTSGAVYIKQ